MSMRAFVKTHRKQLIFGGVAVLLLAAWYLLGGAGSAGDEIRGKGSSGGGGDATETVAEGYTIADRSWADLPASPPPEPPPYVSPEEERLAKDLLERLQNMDIAIEGK